MDTLKKYLLLVFGLILLVSCKKTIPEPIAVQSVSLNATSMELTEGESKTLIAVISPDNAENKRMTWSSSDSAIASVSNGKVTAHKAGKSIITAKTEDGSKTSSCEILVFPIGSGGNEGVGENEGEW